MKDENLVESVDIDADELFQKINQCGSLKLYRHTDQSEEEGDQMELESYELNKGVLGEPKIRNQGLLIY